MKKTTTTTETTKNEAFVGIHQHFLCHTLPMRVHQFVVMASIPRIFNLHKVRTSSFHAAFIVLVDEFLLSFIYFSHWDSVVVFLFLSV